MICYVVSGILVVVLSQRNKQPCPAQGFFEDRMRDGTQDDGCDKRHYDESKLSRFPLVPDNFTLLSSSIRERRQLVSCCET